MADKEAVVVARLDGADSVANGFGKIADSAKGAGDKVGKGWKDAGGAIRDSVQGVVSDIAHVVTAAGAISFAGSVMQVHQLEDSVSRMGVASNRTFDSMRDGVSKLSGRINEIPNATAAWVSAVGKLTYSYDGAAASAQGAAEYAALVGESVQEVAPLVVTMEQLTGATGDSARGLRVLTAQADALGTIGGPKALGDMFEHLKGQITGIGDPISKTTALLSGFGGKAGTPQQRERALGRVISTIEANPEGLEREWGLKRGSLTDEYGHLKDVAGTVARLKKFSQSSAGNQFRSEQLLGREADALVRNTDISAIRAAETVAPSAAGTAALEAEKNTPAGKRRAAEVERQNTMIDTVGSGSTMGGAADWFNEFSAKHPVLGMLGSGVGVSLLGKGVGAALGAAGSALTGGGGAAAATGAATTAAGAAAATTAGATATGTLASLAAPIAPILGFSYWAANQNEDLVQKSEKDEAERQAKLRGASQVQADRDNLSASKETAAQRAARIKSGVKFRSGGMQVFKDGEAPSADSFTPSSAAPGGTPDAAASGGIQGLLAQLNKAVAALTLAQQAAAKSPAEPRKIEIEVVDSTASKVDAMVRGAQ